MLACMLQNLEAIGCLGAQPSSLTTPLSATQQGDRYHVLTGTVYCACSCSKFDFSLCRGENEKWAEPLLISLLGLCFGRNRQRLLRHFRRLKHEPVREKAAKNVFAGVFVQMESILFSSKNRYRETEPHNFCVVLPLYATRNKAPKICCAFLF